MAATNIVEYTNPITNIKYTFEFTNRNSSGPDPWVDIDTSVNVLQEDNAGQSYEISVKHVWDNSLTLAQQPVVIQVRCTRDSTAMSSAVSQNGWMSDNTGGCNSTSAHNHTWYDRRNGPSIWNLESTRQLAYKGVQGYGSHWVYVGNLNFWPIGDNNYFARLQEKFCLGGHSLFDVNFYLKSDPSASNTGAPSPPPPAITPKPTIGGSHPGITPSGGTGSSPRGSGIAYEYIEYSQSSASPTFSSITPTQTVSFPLSDPARIPSALGLIVGNSSNNGTSWNLHYAVKDKADNVSNSVTYPFKIDNVKPIISNVNINNGFNKSIDNEIIVYCDTYDEDSGVIQYYISEILGGVEDTSTRLHTTLSPVISPAHTIDRVFTFNNTPGQRTIRIKTMDQADNYQISDFDVEVSSQRAVWHNFAARRNAVTTFKVEVDVDVEIVADNPDLLSQYYFTFDRLDFPSASDFIDLRNNMDTSHWIDNLEMIENTGTPTHLYVFVKTANGFFSKKAVEIDNTSSTTLGPITTIDTAEGEIEINSPIKRTSNRTNSYRLRAKGNTVHYQHSSQPHADLITGYTIRDDGSSPSNPPAYNSATLHYEDASSDGWFLIDPANNEYTNANQDYTFSSPTSETKNVNLFAATVRGDIIVATETVEYETDQLGPQANTVIINGNTAFVTSGAPPNERFEVADPVNIPSVPIQVDLYDVSEVYRWKFSAFQIPGYTNLRFDTTTDWNIEATPAQNLTLNLTVNFSVSSLNTYYLYSMDALENISENRIKVEYIDPNDLSGGGMGSTQNVAKFEGKPHEHITRNTITSMFGDGTRHETFMSKRHSEDLSGHEAKSIIDNRTHKLSEYSGLRVYNKDTRTQETLADVGNPIKFSHFKGKRPVITSQKISAYTTDRTIEEIPNKIGDIRNFCVLMDIDTGIGTTPHTPLENQNLIDIDAEWNVRFIPAFDNTIQISKYPPNRSNFYTSNHGVLTCNFDEEGTYVVRGTTSFGDVLIGTYFISNSATVDPIPTHPSVLGPVSSNASFDVSYRVDQLSLGVDAVFAFDASVSYSAGNPTFLSAATDAFPSILNTIDNFSKDSSGTSSSRYAVVEFGDFNEIKLISNFGAVNSRTGAIAALSGITQLQHTEPQWAVVKQIADRTISPALTDWRTTALKMIFLFSDTPPDDATNENDWVAAVNDKEIYFVLFDGEEGINDAFHNKGVKFISIIPLKAGSGDTDIQAAMSQLFSDYQSSTSYDLRPHVPGIFKSCVANPAYHSGAMPIPFAEKTGSNEVHFKVELDEDVISNFIGPASLISAGTTIQIETYIMAYNATNNPIQRQKLIISHTF